MRSLQGKTALVTGAAAGIGRAIARRLAAQGMRVALSDRNEVGLEDACRELRERGADATAHRCDLTEPDQVVGLAQAMLDRSAGVDLLVNNAGVAHYGPTHEMAWSEWERLLATNYLGHVRLTHELLDSLLARPEAHVLNVCSVLGLTGMPRVTAYCSTKFAMVGYSESLRAEYGRQGLGVTALCPGFVQTALLDDASPGQHRRPPALFCVSVDRVARAAVKAIRRNRQRVVVDPVGGLVRGAMRMAPTLFDALHSFGRSKRVARKRRELAALDPDPTTALRLKLEQSSAVKRPLEAPTVYRPERLAA